MIGGLIFIVLLSLVLAGATSLFIHLRRQHRQEQAEMEELQQRLEVDANIDRPRITHLADGGWRFEFDGGTMVELGPGRAHVNVHYVAAGELSHLMYAQGSTKKAISRLNQLVNE